MNNASFISYFISNLTNSGDIVLFIGTSNNIAKLAKEIVVLMSKVKV
ncbi:hypothetical protein [Wolbachia endosymbiont of Dipetalonema caudispina]|nr:hypothetical protein [Wolbachia endosymbiont of Dipetalonema caudispina]